ncbi:hypothetical protein AOQ84DRAFT_149310 [Glonium stellatum]|uniref:Transcriptional regulator n=1 Tax=Glonium stellatum TaxID=574774 RepID=A0A8E2ES96_9PEZI|nr:hypothetical protein AOQ84DRAFT_149310 [Glonium stellatum]
MSDSDESMALPSDGKIEQTLRNTVANLFASGKSEEITVKRVRTIAEEKLGLPQDFLKNQDWKARSNAIIHDEVDQHDAEDAPSSPVNKPTPRKKDAPKASFAKPKPAPKKTKQVAEGPRGVKRRSPAPKAKPPKRRKVAISSDEESDAAKSDVSPPEELPSEPETEPKNVRRGKRAKVVEEDTDEEMDDEITPKQPTTKPKQANSESGEEAEAEAAPKSPEPQVSPDTKGDISESELSSLIDEPPAKRKRQKKSPSHKPTRAEKSVKSAKTKPSKSKDPKDLDPHEAEIKRLQGWLVKCGIRKLWHKELASYDTSRAKIDHLKDMLKDVGMDGRYSVEKANKIKEQRELAAELDAVQEGAKRWGQVDSDEEGRKPRRRLARGFKDLALIRDDDGEEGSD